MNKVSVDNGLLSIAERQIRPLYIEGYTHQLSYLPVTRLSSIFPPVLPNIHLKLHVSALIMKLFGKKKIYLELPIQSRKTPLQMVATGLLVLHSGFLMPGTADTMWLRCE